MSDPTARLSTALADRYRLERRLGEGGMATVYLAEDLKHGRRVLRAVARGAVSTLPIAVLGLTLACRARDEGAQVNAATDLPPVITITAWDYRFQAPDTIAAGFTTFRFVNNSDQLHMAHLVQLQAGETIEELLEGYGQTGGTVASRPQSFTEYLKGVDGARRFGGPAAGPHTTSADVTQYLDPGSYAWICLRDLREGVLHSTRGMARAFVVRPAVVATRQTTPEATVSIRLIDYAFVLNSPLKVGRQTIRVENSGPEPHEIALLKLDVGVTMADIQANLEDPRGPLPARRVAGVTALDPGLHAYIDVDLAPGDYLLVCFISAPDGRSHVAHGMIQLVRVG